MTLKKYLRAFVAGIITISFCFIGSPAAHADVVNNVVVRIPHLNTVDYRLRDVKQPVALPTPVIAQSTIVNTPAPPPVAPPVIKSKPPTSQTVVVGSGILAAIARCESGNRPTVVNSSGHAGLYQFDRGTWLSNGGGQYAPTANLATAAQQTAIAEIVLSRRGTQPWLASKHCWG